MDVCFAIHLPHSARLIPVARKRTLNPFRPGGLLFAPAPHSLHPHRLRCQLPGFRGVKACIIFHQLSVLISTKACALEQPLRLFPGLNFTDIQLLPFPRLNAAQRGWICKTNAAVCERESQVAQKGHFSQAMGWRKLALCGRQINQKQKTTCRRSASRVRLKYKKNNI